MDGFDPLHPSHPFQSSNTYNSFDPFLSYTPEASSQWAYGSVNDQKTSPWYGEELQTTSTASTLGSTSYASLTSADTVESTLSEGAPAFLNPDLFALGTNNFDQNYSWSQEDLLGLSSELPKKENPVKPFECDECGRRFVRSADLRQHASSVHDPLHRDCPIPDCVRKGTNGFARHAHLHEHLSSCHKVHFPKRRRVVTRIDGQLNEPQQAPKLLGQEQDGTKGKAGKESKPTSRKSQYTCRLCGIEKKQIYDTRGGFKRHVNNIHRAQWIYTCPMNCGWTSPRRDKVHTHMASSHKGMKRLTSKEIDLLKELIASPPTCDLCSTPVGSWDAWFTCFERHCQIDKLEPNHRNSKTTTFKPDPFLFDEDSYGRYSFPDSVDSGFFDMDVTSSAGAMTMSPFMFNSNLPRVQTSCFAGKVNSAPGEGNSIPRLPLITVKDCTDTHISQSGAVCPTTDRQHNLSPVPSSNGMFSDEDKLRSETGSPDSGDSDIYGDVDSIFGGEDWTPSPDMDPDGTVTRRLKTVYANYLYLMICQQVFISHPANATGNDSPNSSQSSTTLPYVGSSSSKGKRKAEQISGNGKGGSDNGDGQDDGDGTSPRRQSKTSRSQGPSPPRFACPFFKRHPDLFMACGLSDHETPSRVKLHINRKHKLPIYCARCSSVFKSERERDSHLRENSCQIQPEVDRICATSEQLQQLSRRSTGRTDRDKWNEIFTILFPGHPLPESPYLDPEVSAEVNLVREAFLNAAPAALRTAIQRTVPEELKDTWVDEIERAVISTHVDVFDRILSELRLARSSQRVPARLQSSFPSETSVTPDSGIGSSVNPADIQAQDVSFVDSQGNAFDPFLGATFEENCPPQNSFTAPLSPGTSQVFLPDIDMSGPFNYTLDEPDDALRIPG